MHCSPEQEKLEEEAEAAETERRAHFNQVELLREKRIREKERRNKVEMEKKAAQVLILLSLTLICFVSLPL